MYFLQERFDTGNFTQIMLAGGIIIILLAVTFLVFIVFARNRQNKLVTEQETMKIEFAQQLLQSRIEVQEQTTSTLSKELHDNVGQLLTTTKMLMGLSERELTHIPDTIKTAQETLGKAINELRTLSKSLDKEWLSQFNFLENLQQEAARINTGHTVQVQVTKPFDNKLPLNADEQIILFRIVQEALQNAIKHAGASQINIDIETSGTLLQVLIKDNGNGFSETEIKNNGMGLANMKHRAKILGGTFNMESQKGKGTCIKIELPVKKNTL